MLSLKFTDEGFNSLISHNHSIRWLIGDVEITFNPTKPGKIGKIWYRIFKVALVPWIRISIVFTFFYVLFFLLNKAFGTLVIEGDVIGYKEDYVILTLITSGFLVLLSMRHMLAQFHNAFYTPGLLRGGDFERFQQVFKRYRDILAMKCDWRWRTLIFGFMGVVILFFDVYLSFTGKQAQTWATMPLRYPWSWISNLIWSFFMWGIVVGNMLWYGMGCAICGHIMQDRIKKEGLLRVIPVSPDGKGGLYVLAEFSFSLFLMFISTMPFVLGWLFQAKFNLPFQIGFPLALLLMGISFFYALWPSHSAMKEAKKKEIERISLLFRRCYDHYVSLPAEDDNMDKILDQMSNLQVLYEKTEKMPVWPFNASMIIRFASLIVIPLTIFSVELVSNKDSIIYNEELTQKVQFYIYKILGMR